MARPQEIDSMQIKTQALELINDEGWETFSIRKLAKNCNVAASTIYLHYENKDALMIDVAAQFWNDCFEGLVLNENDDFFTQLRTFYFHVLTHLEKFKSSLIAYFSTMKFSQKSVGKEAMGAYVARIRAKIEKLIQSSSLNFDEDFINQVGIKTLTKFILDNLINMLMRNDHDYESFEIILKRLIIK